MQDDGQNGDAKAGDGIYTLHVPFNEPAVGQVQLQVSVAFQGLIRRTISLTLAVPVWNLISDHTLGVAITYPPTYTESKSISGPVIDETGATAAIALGTTVLSDGTSDSGITLYVYPLTNLSSQTNEPGPPFDPSQCRPIIVSNGSFQGQICAQTIQDDAIDGSVYNEQVTVVTQRFQYVFVVNSSSSTDPSVTTFNQMLSTLQLF